MATPSIKFTEINVNSRKVNVISEILLGYIIGYFHQVTLSY